MKYNFSHSNIFVLVYAVVMKIQSFESAYNSAYKELNFICRQYFFTHVPYFKCPYFFKFFIYIKIQNYKMKLIYLQLLAVYTLNICSSV